MVWRVVVLSSVHLARTKAAVRVLLQVAYELISWPWD